jgi:biopolymer transport protein ExbD
MGMSTGSGGPRKAMADINVTPMVDVMLVLLIIFMVSTPIMVQQSAERMVDVTLPLTRENPETVDLSNNERLILVIERGLRARIGDAVVNDCSAAAGLTDAEAFFAAASPCFDEISQRLGLNPRLQQDEKLYLVADTAVPYGYVVGVMHRLRQTGVTNVGMVTYDNYRMLQNALNATSAPAP